MPSNNGRGYVLRRIIRRAVRHGRKLGIRGSFLPTLAQNVIDGSKDGYPELEEKRDFILSVIRAEEEKFGKTYEQGMDILAKMEEKLLQSQINPHFIFNTLSSILPLCIKEPEKAYEMLSNFSEYLRGRLYKRELQNTVPVYEEMDPAVNSAFVGYDKLTCDSKIVAMAQLRGADSDGEDAVTEALTDGQTGAIITAETPFYGTMGGQVGDRGTITSPDGEFAVETTEHVAGAKIAMIGRVTRGMFKIGDAVTLHVDEKSHLAICRNHSATHLLQKALREVLGSHVEQKGSYQDAERTRFDFSHFQAMTAEELKKVENIVNEKIAEDLPVVTDVMSLEDARKTGAMALFGEKYGDRVRVVRMGDFSTELCGGTHVSSTGKIRQFKILSESGVAAGVRRIEALTGDNVTAYYAKLEQEINEAAALVKASPETLADHIRRLQEELKSAKAETEALKTKAAQAAVGDVTTEAEDVSGIKVLVKKLDDVDMNDMRTLGDELKGKLGESLIVLASATGGKVSLMATATDGAVKKGAHAGNLIRTAAKLVGGGGGGRPNMAQAGGRDVSKIDDALAAAKAEARKQLAK